VARTQRLRAFSAIDELVAARRREGGGWEILLARYGRLAASGVSPPYEHPRRTIEVLVATGETVQPAPPPTPAGSTEEARLLMRWLARDGTRLVSSTQPWALPVSRALGVPRAATVDLES
jgi:DNA polymerase-3 subunit epsilon